MELDSWLSSQLKRTRNIFLPIQLVLIYYLLPFLQLNKIGQNLSFDVRHPRSVTCGVTIDFEITSGCCSWLKFVPISADNKLHSILDISPPFDFRSQAISWSKHILTEALVTQTTPADEGLTF